MRSTFRCSAALFVCVVVTVPSAKGQKGPASDVLRRHASTLPDDAPPTRAQAWGVGHSTGVLGGELVLRSLPTAPRLGGAVAFGFLGPGARVTAALAPPDRRLVSYAGVGVTTAWLKTPPLPGLEAGAQLWPRRRGGWYLDAGASVAGFWRGRTETVWLPRALLGRTF